ncbi:polysaccharide pyruvyl transferase family protein [Pseudomonas sp. GOM6]|uniref:polysaccharide pyruvyl transferase family protein n=1 Tax=Pseudomonas sp. GOM6 TaxID=3036944 RepID=UPI002409B669|nr:polysaccharide pyruvyl transferase family protein [Pseudomonas sp. GOM6]MDG1582589.1 polysaccharide pyruvyl transferase family protein [Pseudomonas sp. GOM6]
MQALLFNDTSYEQHHGSQLVVRQIYRLATSVGIHISRACPMRYDWQSDERLKADIRRADLCLINGEGTMHDDAQQALRLGELAGYCKTHGVPCFLINSVWQRNDRLNELARDFSGIYVRDRLSAQELERAGIIARVVPDLTLSLDELPASGSRSGGLVNGSVFAERTWEGWQAARNARVAYLSIKALPPLQLGKGFPAYVIKSMARRIRAELKRLSSLVSAVPDAQSDKALTHLRWRYSARTLHSFLKRLGAAEWVVTGRFHCVTLCLLMRTPFVTVASNTHKIESLLQEAGLQSRLADSYAEALEQAPRWPLSPAERHSLDAFLVRSREQAYEMFRQIAQTCCQRES